jgi:thiol-disulfide isomerase/thioredoxin
MGILIVLLFVSAGTGISQDTNIPQNDPSAEELSAFGVTLYGEGEMFPFEGLATLEGEAFEAGELLGKAVLVNLGATWCPYCREEKKSLERLRAGGLVEGLEVVGIFVGEKAEAAKGYMEGEGYTFMALADEGNALRERYAPRLPASYVVDGEGEIVARINGSKEWDGDEAVRVLGYMARGME